MDVEVQAYAGAAYPERPLRVRWEGRWRRVIAVQAQQRSPGSLCFTVLLEAARRDIRLRLCYHYANDAWQAEKLGGES